MPGAAAAGGGGRQAQPGQAGGAHVGVWLALGAAAQPVGGGGQGRVDLDVGVRDPGVGARVGRAGCAGGGQGGKVRVRSARGRGGAGRWGGGGGDGGRVRELSWFAAGAAEPLKISAAPSPLAPPHIPATPVSQRTQPAAHSRAPKIMTSRCSSTSSASLRKPRGSRGVAGSIHQASGHAGAGAACAAAAQEAVLPAPQRAQQPALCRTQCRRHLMASRTGLQPPLLGSQRGSSSTMMKKEAVVVCSVVPPWWCGWLCGRGRAGGAGPQTAWVWQHTHVKGRNGAGDR